MHKPSHRRSAEEKKLGAEGRHDMSGMKANISEKFEKT